MRKLALLAFVTLLGPQARADVITQHQADDLSQFQGHFADLVFEKYSGPGTLISVTLTENASIKNDFSIAFANPATIAVSVSESIFGFGPITISRSATSAGAGTVTQPGAFTPFMRTLTLDPNDFVGTGTYAIPVNSEAMSHFSSDDGNGFGSVLTFGQADATLTFRFAAVPEPSTFLLAGVMGMAAMTGAAWRSKRSA